MNLDTPADACAALAVLIAGADEISTTKERQFLFGTLADNPLFEHLKEEEFADLLVAVTEWVVTSFPWEGGRVSDQGVTQLVGLIREALPADLRTEALRAAVGLARADGVSSEEEALLGRVCVGLGLDPEIARTLLDGAS